MAKFSQSEKCPKGRPSSKIIGPGLLLTGVGALAGGVLLGGSAALTTTAAVGFAGAGAVGVGQMGYEVYNGLNLYSRRPAYELSCLAQNSEACKEVKSINEELNETLIGLGTGGVLTVAGFGGAKAAAALLKYGRRAESADELREINESAQRMARQLDQDPALKKDYDQLLKQMRTLKGSSVTDELVGYLSTIKDPKELADAIRNLKKKKPEDIAKKLKDAREGKLCKG